MKIGAGTRIRKHPNVVSRTLGGDGGAVLLRLDTSAYHGVNLTGAAIWDLVRDGITLEELTRAVGEAFEAPPPGLSEEIEGFVAALVERGLLEVLEGPAPPASPSSVPPRA